MKQRQNSKAHQNKVTGEAIWQWRHLAILDAKQFGISSREVDWLLMEVAGLDALALHLGSYRQLDQIPLKRPLEQLTQLWQEHLYALLPLQYVAGSLPWRDLTVQVNPSVLSPRPETEFLIDLIEILIQKQPDLAQGIWVDLGTGSGAIAIALARLLQNAQIFASDISEAAIQLANQNITAYNLTNRITLLQGSWWDPFTTREITGMLSNPPYIPTQMIEELEIQVKNHEPHLALDGGQDGLRDIRYLIESAPIYLCSGGVWLIELMINQSRIVAELLEKQGSYENIEIYQDFNGIERYVLARRR